MRVITSGATRTVLLTRRWAIKVPGAWAAHPRLWWKSLLTGLLANIQEATFSRTGWPELCPVRFALPGGFLIIMPRAAELSRSEWDGFDPQAFSNRPDYVVPVEGKLNSFGRLSGRVVAVDYGS